MDSFTIEGKTYYAQYRKCSKTTCHCQDDGDQGHGPYWYTRDENGTRGYVGRELPENVKRAREVNDRRLQDILKERRRLVYQLDAITRLLGNKALDDDDRANLEILGFGDCLVSTAELATTQGGLVSGVLDGHTQGDLVPSGALQETQDSERGLVHRPGHGRAQEREHARPGAL